MCPLTVLCWDDPRAILPVRALGDAFSAAGGGPVEVRVRSLSHFNDGPIEDVLADVDLALIDYPTVPRLAGLGAIVALTDDAVVTPAIGSSRASFAWRGQTWAAAIDAACQVAVSRGDLLAALGRRAPTSWDEVVRLADIRPGALALPLHPADAFCALLSVSYAFDPPGRAQPTPLTFDDRAVELLLALTARIDPDCWGMQPPEFLTRMTSGTDWAYCPLVFGYARCSGPEWPGIAWHDAPTVGDGPPGSVLGGAGLAVSSAGDIARSQRFAAFCTTADAAAVIADSQGQPANERVWDSADPGFFTSTRATMTAAVVRPSHPLWVDFHAEAGDALVDGLRRRDPAAVIARRLAGLAGSYSIPILEAA